MRYLLILLLAGCSSLPSGQPDYVAPHMVELPEGAIILKAEDQISMEMGYRALAIEMLRLRHAVVPFGNCRMAEWITLD